MFLYKESNITISINIAFFADSYSCLCSLENECKNKYFEMMLRHSDFKNIFLIYVNICDTEVLEIVRENNINLTLYIKTTEIFNYKYIFESFLFVFNSIHAFVIVSMKNI